MPSQQRRHSLIDASQDSHAQPAREARVGKITAIQRAIADTEARSRRLIRTLEIDDGLDPDFITDIRQRRAELHAQRSDLEHQLAETRQQGQDIRTPGLADHLPVAPVQPGRHARRGIPQAVRSPSPRNPLQPGNTSGPMLHHPGGGNDRRCLPHRPRDNDNRQPQEAHDARPEDNGGNTPARCGSRTPRSTGPGHDKNAPPCDNDTTDSWKNSRLRQPLDYQESSHFTLW